MLIVSNSRGVSAVLSATDTRLLDRIAANLAPLVPLKKLGRYRNMSAADVWSVLVGQVCVMGSARHWEKAQHSPEMAELLTYDIVRSQPNVRAYLQSKLQSLKATRFHREAAKKLADAITSPSLFGGDRVTAFDGLSDVTDPQTVRAELRKRWNCFGLKSASDFMITVGLSHDVLALDTRVIGFLEKYCNLDPKSHRIRSNKRHYLSVESSLREYCQGRELSLAQFDRLVFQFSVQSVISFLVEYPQLQFRQAHWVDDVCA